MYTYIYTHTYIHVPVCIYISEKRCCISVSPLSPVYKGIERRDGASQHRWPLVPMEMRHVSGCQHGSVRAGQANSCSDSRQNLLMLSVWCDQGEALSCAGTQPWSLGSSWLSLTGGQGLQHPRALSRSCLQSLHGEWLAHFGHSHLRLSAKIVSLFVCYFYSTSMSIASLFLCFPFPLTLFCALNILTYWVLLC